MKSLKSLIKSIIIIKLFDFYILLIINTFKYYLGNVITESINSFATEGRETYVTVTTCGTEQHPLKSNLFSVIMMVITYWKIPF